MIYAINYKTADFDYHQDKAKFPVYLHPDGKVWFTSEPETYVESAPVALVVEEIGISDKDYFNHGLIMYIAWFLLGLVSLASKRYFKAPWMGMHIIHLFSGIAIFILTVVSALVLISKFNWKITSELHSIIGVVVLALVSIVTFSGIARIAVIKGKYSDTNEDKGMKVAKFHRLSGYFILLIANIAMFTGSGHYLKDIREKETSKVIPIMLTNMPLFFVIVIILEINKRVIDKIRSLDFGETSKHPAISL